MPARPIALLLTCEHAGNRVPPPFQKYFRGSQELLESHRGWDPGALALAKCMQKITGAPLLWTDVTRLLVEANRSLHHPNLFSKISRAFSEDLKEEVVRRYYQPHRASVIEAIQSQIDRGFRVVHLGIHSFTPVLDGVERNAEFGLLYDPRRPWEKRLCHAWYDAFSANDHGWRMRRNYPYRGTSDGLTTSLRKQFSDATYAGIEIEVNQKLLASVPPKNIAQRLVAISELKNPQQAP